MQSQPAEFKGLWGADVPWGEESAVSEDLYFQVCYTWFEDETSLANPNARWPTAGDIILIDLAAGLAAAEATAWPMHVDNLIPRLQEAVKDYILMYPDLYGLFTFLEQRFIDEAFGYRYEVNDDSYSWWDSRRERLRRIRNSYDTAGPALQTDPFFTGRFGDMSAKVLPHLTAVAGLGIVISAINDYRDFGHEYSSGRDTMLMGIQKGVTHMGMARFPEISNCYQQEQQPPERLQEIYQPFARLVMKELGG